MGFGLSVILLIGLRFVGIFLALALARLAHRPCLWLGSRHRSSRHGDCGLGLRVLQRGIGQAAGQRELSPLHVEQEAVELPGRAY